MHFDKFMLLLRLAFVVMMPCILPGLGPNLSLQAWAQLVPLVPRSVLLLNDLVRSVSVTPTAYWRTLGWWSWSAKQV